MPTSLPPTANAIDPAQSRYCFPHPTIQANRPSLYIASAGYEKVAPNYTILRKDFPVFALEFVASGYGHARIGKNEISLMPGSWFTYGPKVKHYIETNPSQVLGKYFVDFYGMGAARVLKETKIKPGDYGWVANQDHVEALFSGIFEFSNGNARCISRSSNYLDLILHNLSTSGKVQPKGDSRTFDTYLYLHKRIEEEFLQFHSNNEICSACTIAPSQLCRLFQKYSTETPFQLLTRLKMAFAANLMLRESASVSEAAYRTGFQDAYHFSRRFKQYFGKSPKEFVQQFRTEGG